MWQMIRERVGRRRLLLGGAAAGAGVLAGGAQRAAAQPLSPLPGSAVLDYGPASAGPDARLGNPAARLGQGVDATVQRYPYWPIDRRPRLEWPNGKRLAFWIGMNIEYFEPGKPATSISTATINLDPDPLNAGWREYGVRVGIWRLMDLLDRYGMRASVLLNSDVALHYPEIVEAGNRRNWAWLAHGKNNTGRWTNMAPDEERRATAEMLSTIRQHTGQQPKGWLGPGLSETYNTPDVFAEAGMTYICDWCNDDEPYPMRVRQGRMISLPYSIEMNDISLFIGKTVSGPAFYEIVTDHFDVLYQEAAQRPRVMALALHPFIVGQPYRYKHLERVLSYIAGHDGVWLATSDEIADWYYQRFYDQALALAPAISP